MLKRDYTMLDLIKISFKCSKGYAGLIALQKLTEGLIPGIQVIIIASFLNTAIQISGGKKELADITIPISLLLCFRFKIYNACPLIVQKN